MTFDSKLTTEAHIDKFFKKSNQKLKALARISNYLTFDKRKIIREAFITSQFSYCPLVWMFYSNGIGKR